MVQVKQNQMIIFVQFDDLNAEERAFAQIERLQRILAGAFSGLSQRLIFRQPAKIDQRQVKVELLVNDLKRFAAFFTEGRA